MSAASEPVDSGPLLSSSAASHGAPGSRRRLLWLAPLALLLVAALGYWAYSTVEQGQKLQRRDELQALLRASSEAVSIWLAAQEGQAHAIASHAGVVEAVVALQAAAHATPADLALNEHPAQRLLREQLSLLLSSTDYERYDIGEPGGVLLSSSVPTDVGMKLQDAGRLDPNWAADTELRVWPPARGRSGAVRMAVSAPILVRGKHTASLLLVFDPSREFYGILSSARSGTTGETYAFDRAGRLLSPSRFDDGLRAEGLLGPESPGAVLSLELRDPGENPSVAPLGTESRKSRPFTRAVERALRERGPGFDVDGYRDYRGVPVLGAWTWLGKYGLGIVTEKDASEAFELRDTVRRALGFLVGTLVLVVAGLLVLMQIDARLRRRTARAERKLEQLGQYRLTRKLGEGGMGTVYAAQHVMLRRPTALKLLKVDGDGGAALARFEREVRITSQLTHPNTIAIYDYGVTPDGTFYYAMELLDGVDLDALVRQTGPLPAARVVHILLQACGSLAEAHAAGLIHRDIKPANLVLCQRGGSLDTLKVLDFGLVKETRGAGTKLTGPSRFMGTPAFVAPELLTDPERVSPRSDIYSLGATAHFLLTGRLLFEKEDAMQLLVAQMSEAPLPPSAHVRGIPDDLERVVLRCLERRPEQRYADMDELASALQECAQRGSWTQAQARIFWDAHAKMAPRIVDPSVVENDTVDLSLEALRQRRLG